MAKLQGWAADRGGGRTAVMASIVVMCAVVAKTVILGGWAAEKRTVLLSRDGVFLDPRVSSRMMVDIPERTRSGALWQGLSGNSGHLPGVNVDSLSLGESRIEQQLHHNAVRRSSLGNPYGVLARTVGETNYDGVLARARDVSNPGGVLARLDPRGRQQLATVATSEKPVLTEAEKEAVYGALSAFVHDQDNEGGSLAAKGLASDKSWAVQPASSAAGGALFDKSLGEDNSWEMQSSHMKRVRAAHDKHKELLKEESVGGSLAALPSRHGEADGVLAQTVTKGDDSNGVLANLPMADPDGVLAIYAHTGEYVEKQQLKNENQRLNQLQQFEHQAAVLHEAQVKRLQALEKKEKQEQQAAKTSVHVAVKADTSKANAHTAVHLAHSHSAAAAPSVAAAKARGQHKQEGSVSVAASTHSNGAVSAVAASKHVESPKAVHHPIMNVHKASPPVAARAVKQHFAAKPVVGARTSSKVVKHQLAEEESKGAEQEQKGQDDDIPHYNDIGWVKQQWDVGSWVLFVIFGPIATVVIMGMVWHCAGPVAAIIMLVILVCLDISSYYYSWFLV